MVTMGTPQNLELVFCRFLWCYLCRAQPAATALSSGYVGWPRKGEKVCKCAPLTPLSLKEHLSTVHLEAMETRAPIYNVTVTYPFMT